MPSTSVSALTNWAALVILGELSSPRCVSVVTQMRSRAGEMPIWTVCGGAVSPAISGAAGSPHASPPGQRCTSAE